MGQWRTDSCTRHKERTELPSRPECSRMAPAATLDDGVRAATISAGSFFVAIGHAHDMVQARLIGPSNSAARSLSEHFEAPRGDWDSTERLIRSAL